MSPYALRMHFVLVHGAYHGAWCWDLLRQQLEADGHLTTAMDLPSEDPDAGAERYAQVVEAAIPAAAKDVVLVGHSLGGLTIPIVAVRIRPLAAIYLCAMLPVPGVSFNDQHADAFTDFQPSEGAFANPDGSSSWPELGAMEVFYQDCPPDLARAAARRLRPQHWRVTREVTLLERWPDGPAAYILCEDDRAVSAEYARRAARAQLGVDAIVMPGGHSPFLSRPRQLADILGRLSVAARVQTG
jgi:pimeloyl-ACP methyl ester carboxylesterase